MTQYETAFLISPNLEEEETEKVITQMAEVVSKKKGKMINEDRWGKRKLAYPIEKFEDAFYVFFHYEGDSDIPSELERLFKQTEAILRYLTVKKELKENIRGKKKRVPAEKERAASQEEEIPEMEATEEEDAIEEKELVEKEEGTEAEMLEKESIVTKETAEKKEAVEEETVEEKEPVEEVKTDEKEEEDQEGIAPPEKSKEEE